MNNSLRFGTVIALALASYGIYSLLNPGSSTELPQSAAEPAPEVVNTSQTMPPMAAEQPDRAPVPSPTPSKEVPDARYLHPEADADPKAVQRRDDEEARIHSIQHTEALQNMN